MEYRQFGRTGTRVLGALPRHDDLRQRGRRGHEPADRRPLPRRRRQLHRHRQRLQPGRLGGDHRPGDQGQARPDRARDEGAVRDGRRHRTRSARRVATCAPRARRRCAGSAPSGSTSTRCTCWDKHTPLEETLSTLDDLVREGKVRYIGASNFAGWHLAKALGVSALHGWEPFVCLQPEYSLITRDVERELHPALPERGPRGASRGARSAAASSPASTRRTPTSPTGTRGGDTENPITFTYRLDDRAWNIVDAVRRPRRETGKSAAQISLNWVLHRRGVTAPIIGARNLTQLDDNLGAVGLGARRRDRQGARRGRARSASATRTSSSSTPADPPTGRSSDGAAPVRTHGHARHRGVPRRDDVRAGDARGRERRDPRPVPRRGRQLRRHREHLQPRRVGGDPRSAAGRPARHRSCSPPSAGCRWGRARTTRARRAG